MITIRKIIGKSKAFFLLILLPTIILLNFNLTTNGHQHKLINGEIVYHCHPFEHSSNNQSPYEDHHHSESEILFLSQTSNSFIIIFYFFILSNLLPLFKKEFHFLSNISLVSKEYHYQINYRAPPVF